MRSPLLHHAGLTKVGLLLPDAVPQRRAPLAAALAQLEAVEAALDDRVGEAEAAEASQQKAAARLAEAELTTRERRGQLNAAETRDADAALAEDEARQGLEQTREAARELRDALTERLASWPELGEALAAPAALAAAVETAVAEAATQRAEATRAQARVEALEPRGPELKASLDRTEAAAATARRDAETAEATVARLREERRERLGGRPADEVEAELDAAQARARAALEASRSARAESDANARAAEAERELRAPRAEARRRAQIEAETRLQAALDAIEPPEERQACAASLDAPPEDVDRLERERQGLLLARTRAQATLQDREDRLSRHLEERPEGPDAELEGAAATRADAETRVEAHRSRFAHAQAALEADDGARARFAELGPELERRAAEAALWAELSALIGSADGKKLRTFAQSLTLEALVEQANLHLESLRPRYRLRRVPAAEMELEVVDRDMGDEIRPISSLSGGETFLASLALALGLSDLSAESVEVESLFVDEGFGALDAESLEVALAALDQLQASGRTVGVVSHVPEVAERLGFEVRVQPVSPGRSRVEVKGP